MGKRGIIIFIFVFLINLQFALALGIGPGKQVVDFKPGLELEYSFTIYADSNQEVEIFSAGEFSELVKFDRKEIVGGGSFTVKITLPNAIEKPGEHIILIGAREKTGEIKSTVMTSVTVQVPIVVKVPYPGKYAEISLSVENANVGEPIEFEVKVASMGKETITATTILEIYSEEIKIDSFNLGTKIIENQKEDIFTKTFDTGNYRPGDYRVVAIVDYQAGTAKEEKNFRIGYLFINVTNYTKEIIKEGIKPFTIEIESLWNDNIENVYGEVYISQDGKNITNFLTPSVNLEGWERKTLLGYIDTEALELGIYDLEIVISYGKDFTIIDGSVNIRAKTDYKIYALLGVLIFLILVIIFIIFKNRKRNLSLKEKNEKKIKKTK